MAASAALETTAAVGTPGAFTIEPTRSTFAASRTALLP